MTDSHLSARSGVRLRPVVQRNFAAGLISRLLPVVVLSAGLVAWLVSLGPAAAQNQRFGNQPRGGGFQPNARPMQIPGSATTSTNSPLEPNFRGAMMPTGSNQRVGGIPEIPQDPGTATGQIGQAIESEEPSDEASSSFAMPAFVTKILSGGWLMLPLGICSMVVLTLSLERMIALRRSRVIPRPFVQRFTECVEDGVLSYDEATDLCKEFDCPVSEVFRAALRRWGRPMFEIEQAVMDAGDRVSEGLRKYLRVFHAISNVAPLIGLLGTVIGMIGAFEVISDQTSIGRPETLASGISTALMTTAGGLSVAIPAYLAYMYFSSKSDRYLGEIERLCQRVIDSISAEGLEENSGAGRSKKRRAA